VDSNEVDSRGEDMDTIGGCERSRPVHSQPYGLWLASEHKFGRQLYFEIEMGSDRANHQLIVAVLYFCGVRLRAGFRQPQIAGVAAKQSELA
jgi:hypothetical protein